MSSKTLTPSVLAPAILFPALRDAVVKLGGRPEQINPQIPSELVIDHSVQVDVFGKPEALAQRGQAEVIVALAADVQLAAGGERITHCR